MMKTESLALKLALLSPRLVKEGKRDEWLALFTDDAILQDPVGPSPFDPSGQGHRGKAAIARFYDNVMNVGGTFDYTIHVSYPCGDECANVWEASITGPDGKVWNNPMVTIYKVNSAGKLVSLRAFWDSTKLESLG